MFKKYFFTVYILHILLFRNSKPIFPLRFGDKRRITPCVF